MSAKKEIKQEFKEYRLDAKKVKRVQKILRAKTESEALEELLQLVIDNDRIDRAHKRLLKSGIEIVDTLGRVPE
jgi:hypothetical protein